MSEDASSSPSNSCEINAGLWLYCIRVGDNEYIELSRRNTNGSFRKVSEVFRRSPNKSVKVIVNDKPLNMRREY